MKNPEKENKQSPPESMEERFEKEFVGVDEGGTFKTRDDFELLNFIRKEKDIARIEQMKVDMDYKNKEIALARNSALDEAIKTIHRFLLLGMDGFPVGVASPPHGKEEERLAIFNGAVKSVKDAVAKLKELKK